jgi:hypothetical protein
MATTVGALNIDLALNTAAFQADMGKAAAALTSNTAAMKVSLEGLGKAFETLESAAGALGVAFGVGELLSFVNEARNAAAELGNVSQQVGVSTDALQAYRFAGLQAGIAQDQLDTSLSRLTRTIGSAAAGNDLALDAFNRLGVGILDANGQVRSTEAVLADVATGLKGITDPSERARLAFELFGRDGQRMLSLLNQNLDEVNQHAIEANVVIPHAVIDRLHEAADATKIFWAQATAVAAEATYAFLKLKDAVAGYLGDLGARQAQLPATPRRGTLAAGRRAAAGQGAPGALADTAGFDFGAEPPTSFAPPPPAGEAAGETSNPPSNRDVQQEQAYRNLIGQLELQRDSVGRLSSEILRLKLSREEEAVQTINGTEIQKKWTQAQIDAAVAVQEQIDSAKDLQADIDRDRERRDATEAYTQQVQRQTEQIQEQAVAARANQVVWDDVSQSYRVASDELQIVSKQQEILNQNLDITTEEARRMAEAYVKATDDLRSAQAASQRQLERINAGVRELDSFSQSVFDHIGQAAANAFIAGGKSALDFRSVVLSVLTDIELEFIKLAAINPLKNALFGGNNPTLGSIGAGGGGLLGSLFGGGGGESLSGPGVQELSPEFDTLATATPDIAAFASGTDSAPGGLSLVGEQGPELVNLPGGSQVLPSDITSRLRSGGGGDTYMIDARDANKEGLMRLSRQLAALHASVETRAVGAVYDAFTRGGTFQRRVSGAS